MVPVAIDVDQVLGGGEQGLEHLLVFHSACMTKAFKIVHQGGSPVFVSFDLILEGVLGLQVVEVLLEELQQAISCHRTLLVVQQAAGLRADDFPR